MTKTDLEPIFRSYDFSIITSLPSIQHQILVIKEYRKPVCTLCNWTVLGKRKKYSLTDC